VAVTFGMLRPREYKSVDWMNAGARRNVTSDTRTNTSMAGVQLRPKTVGTIQRAFAEMSAIGMPSARSWRTDPSSRPRRRRDRSLPTRDIETSPRRQAPLWAKATVSTSRSANDTYPMPAAPR